MVNLPFFGGGRRREREHATARENEAKELLRLQREVESLRTANAQLEDKVRGCGPEHLQCLPLVLSQPLGLPCTHRHAPRTRARF